MKDRARIEDKMSAKDIELADTKEEAKYFICNKIVDMIRADNCDSEGSIDEGDIQCLKDDCQSILNICAKVDKCKNMKALKTLLKLNYDKDEVKEALGV